MKKYTYVPGSFIAAWLIWELIVRLGGFNEALFPTPYKVLIGFGELIGDGVLFKDIADSLVRFFTADARDFILQIDPCQRIKGT